MFNYDLFNRVVGPAYLSGVKEAVNDAQLTNYRTLGYIMRGQPMSRVLQGGKNLQDYIYLSTNPRMRTYSPGISKQTYSDPQPGVMMTQNWRFFITHDTVRDEEIDLSAGTEMSEEARFQRIKDILWTKRQDRVTDTNNYWERAAWATPKADVMEGSSLLTTEMASIPCIINEAGINGASGTTKVGQLQRDDVGANAWTTVQNLNPTTAGQTNWANQCFGYGNTSGSGFLSTSLENVISTFDLAFDQLDFEPPPMDKEYFENPAAVQKPRPFVACSAKGKQRLIQLYRLSNNRWENMTDPWMQPTYNGYSIVYIKQLDSAKLYYDTAGGQTGALTTEAAADDIGPRYYLINPEYLTMIWNQNAYMQPIEVGRSLADPTAKVTPYKTYGNLWARSRLRQGLVYPLDDYA